MVFTSQETVKFLLPFTIPLFSMKLLVVANYYYGKKTEGSNYRSPVSLLISFFGVKPRQLMDSGLN